MNKTWNTWSSCGFPGSDGMSLLHWKSRAPARQWLERLRGGD
jgi:hypothetical protein